MPKKVQPGVKIDSRVWEEFREDVQARKGAVRGHLQTELENAIRDYLGDGQIQNTREVNTRLSRIESNLGIGNADGGGDTTTDDSHTHAPSRVDGAEQEKPAANAATEKKIAYLAERVLDREVPQSREITSVPESVLADVVKEEYGFRKDTAKRYVERLINRFDLVGHPSAANVLVSVEKRDALLEDA